MHQMGFGLHLDSNGRTSGGDARCKCLKRFGGPGRVRTDDLFHAMEARSQLRHRPTMFSLTIPHGPCARFIDRVAFRLPTMGVMLNRLTCALALVVCLYFSLDGCLVRRRVIQRDGKSTV